MTVATKMEPNIWAELLPWLLAGMIVVLTLLAASLRAIAFRDRELATEAIQKTAAWVNRRNERPTLSRDSGVDATGRSTNARAPSGKTSSPDSPARPDSSPTRHASAPARTQPPEPSSPLRPAVRGTPAASPTFPSAASDTNDWKEIGLLGAFGYQAGKTGLSTSERRRILARAVREPIPRINDESWRSRFGAPRTRQRVRAIIAELERLADLRRADPRISVAVDDWTSDAEWLRRLSG